jgi:hypothetical protein
MDHESIHDIAASDIGVASGQIFDPTSRWLSNGTFHKQPTPATTRNGQ